MGNSQSTNSSALLNKPLISEPPLVSKEDEKSSNQSSDETSSFFKNIPIGLRNPGTIEDLNNQCKNVFPTNFEGFRMMFNKGINNHFQISHTLNMSNLTPAGYRFGATYVGTKMIGPGEAYPLLMGEIDPNGNVNANIIHQFNPRLKTKFVTQVRAYFELESFNLNLNLILIFLFNSVGRQ